VSDQWQTSVRWDQQSIAESEADLRDPYIGPNTSAQLVALGRLEGLAGEQRGEQSVRRKQMPGSTSLEESHRTSLSTFRRLVGRRGQHIEKSGDELPTQVGIGRSQGIPWPADSTKELPNVSVIITCQGNERTIREVVVSLLNQDYPQLREIILVVSHSGSTWEALRGIYDRRLAIREVTPPPGIRNSDFKRDFGIRTSSCELVYLADPSIVLQSNWLSCGVTALVENTQNGKIAGAQSTGHDFMRRFIDRRRPSASTPTLTRPVHQAGEPSNVFDSGTRPDTWSPFAGRAEQSSPVTAGGTGLYRIGRPQGYGMDGYGTPNASRLNQGWAPDGYPALETPDTSDQHGRTPTEVTQAAHLSPAALGHTHDYHRGVRYKQDGSTSTPGRRAASAGAGRYVSPPTDKEKYSYIRGGQKRWFILAQYAAFLSVIISFAGFTLSSYETFIFSIPLVLFAIEQTLSLYTSSRRRRIDLASHKSFVSTWVPRRYPSVDVFVPTAGEDLDLLDNTMRHMSRLEWSGELRVFVLDDSGRSAVRNLARKHGLYYLARPGSEYKKAGNLRYAAERTKGDIIVIFDADFVPRQDFLVELVPYMDDPSVGIVQSPQFFDTTRQMNWIQRSAGSTQELFYRFIQPSRDALGAAVCVGTSALYRRAALDAVGGFPLLGQSEDIYTGLYMSDAGYSICYVPVILSKGLTPNNLDNFIAQQYRWCEGSMSMLATRRFHTTPCLPLRARLCFWSGFLYYISTALSALIIPLPTIIMTWLFPEWVRSWNTIWLVGALALWLVAYPLIMRSHWRLEVLRIQTVYGFAHLFNIADLIRDKVVAWHPTGSKAPAPVAIRVKRFYSLYLGLTLSAAAVGLVLRITEDGISTFVGMLTFFMINLYVAGPLVASGIAAELRVRRGARITEGTADSRVMVTA
jgi:cellulose synthase (UDP-forming)